MNGEWPEFVQALGIAAAAVIGAWQARTAAKVRDLEKRLAAVEEERDTIRQLLRSAIHHIRDWMEWSRTHIPPGVPPPPLPDDLRDEV